MASPQTNYMCVCVGGSLSLSTSLSLSFSLSMRPTRTRASGFDRTRVQHALVCSSDAASRVESRAQNNNAAGSEVRTFPTEERCYSCTNWRRHQLPTSARNLAETFQCVLTVALRYARSHACNSRRRSSSCSSCSSSSSSHRNATSSCAHVASVKRPSLAS